MKKYIERLRTERTPHERRGVALQIAGVMTAVLFVGWVSTLGVRLANRNENVANTAEQNTAATLVAVQEASSTLGY